MDTVSTPYRVHQCSKCQGGTEYYCESCRCDLCLQCKEYHVRNLQTIDHNVVTYCDKLDCIPKPEFCLRHPSNICIKYCDLCELPVCYHCRKHRNHRQLDVRTVSETKRQQLRKHIQIIRSEVLFSRPVFMQRIRADYKTCRAKFSNYQSEMLTKAERLKDLIDKLQTDFMYNVFCDFDFKHRCLKQRIELIRHISGLQNYVGIYEQSAFSPIQFLSSIKSCFPKIHLSLHTSRLFMTELLNKEDVIDSLSAIQITERGIRRVGNECLLKLMSGPVLLHSITLRDVRHCHHISCVTPDMIWVSDDGTKLILTNTTGDTLHIMDNLYSGLFIGPHTVNSESELIFINEDSNISKLSKDMKTTSTFVEKTDNIWKPRCVYWSASIGDLLVGMCRVKSWSGKVARYNKSGKHTQTIEHDNTGRGLYREPNYITENNNGDVVVSDCYLSGSVVATDNVGRHHFSYTGHPSGSGLKPRGICADALSHILVCDEKTNTVQMLEKDGQFLSHLFIRPSGIFTPYGLSYDVKTHHLWVGSKTNNKVVVYRYIDRQDASADLNQATAELMASMGEIRTTEAEKLQQGNECLLKLMSSPKLLHSLSVTGVDGCYHISFMTSDQVWVSDIGQHLILTNTIRDTLHRVEDSCSDLYGLHTVNSESEMIYIDMNHNINKLSKDMKTTTTLIERTDSTWRPLCVYWSPSTGNLLVGMYNFCTETGKVTRYRECGRLTQTIEYDNTGLELYNEPIFLAENNNGDVVVSDSKSSAVVVTDRGGRHRFSYTGHPSGSGLYPHGICTDALSHILVCDEISRSVQLLDRDGQFLSHLLTESEDMGKPFSLSYDAHTHRLRVGSINIKKLCAYTYLTKPDDLTEKESTRSLDEDVLFRSRPA